MKKLHLGKVKAGLCMILCLTMVLGCLSVSAEAENVFTDRFDSDAVGGVPTGWVSAAGSPVIAALPGEDGNCLSIGNTGSVNSVAERDFTPQQDSSITAITVDVRQTGTRSSARFLQIWNGAKSKRAALIRTSGSSILMQYADNQTLTLVSDYQLNRWYQIAVVTDRVSNELRVYVDGIRIGADVSLSMINADLDNIAKIESLTETAGTHYLDNVSVDRYSNMAEAEAAITSCADNDSVFEENFDAFAENTNITTGNGYVAAAGAKVVSKGEGRDRVLELINSGARARLLKSVSPAPAESLVIDFDFMQENKTEVDTICTAADSTGNCNAFYIRSDGKDISVSYDNPVGVTEKSKVLIENYEAGKWYSFRIALDFEKQAFRVYVDNEECLVGTRLGFMYKDQVNNIGRVFDTRTDTSGSFCIDNIFVYTSKLNQQLEGLTMPDIDGIMKDISLPCTTQDGTVITWESSNQSVINNNGWVTLPKTAQDTFVTLKGTVSKGKNTAHHSYIARVKGCPGDVCIGDAELKAGQDASLGLYVPMYNTTSEQQIVRNYVALYEGGALKSVRAFETILSADEDRIADPVVLTVSLSGISGADKLKLFTWSNLQDLNPESAAQSFAVTGGE